MDVCTIHNHNMIFCRRIILFLIHYSEWGLKFGTTKSRTTDISKFQNYEY